MILGEEFKVDVDTTEADQKIDQLNDKIENTKENLLKTSQEVEEKTQESFNEVMGMMRASYMVLTGVGQAVGATMGQIFSSIFSITISTIQTFQAIAAAIAAGGGWVQAALMTSSLVTAIINLTAAMSGQEELSARVSGFNTMLQGIGGLLDSMNFS